MKVPLQGAVDCDLHPATPTMAALLPYLSDYWRDQFVDRHIDRTSFTLTSYPPNSPLSARPDWRLPSGLPGSDLDAIRRQALDPFGSRFAICNVLHGALALFNEDMADGALLGHQRLDRQGIARPRAAPARVHPDSGAQP